MPHATEDNITLMSLFKHERFHFLCGRVHIPKDQEDGQEIDGRMRCTKTQKGWIRTGKEPSMIGTAGGGC